MATNLNVQLCVLRCQGHANFHLVSAVNAFFFFFFFFLGPQVWHVEVPRLGVKLELQLLAFTTARAMWEPSCVCNLHCCVLNMLSEASDRTHILVDTSRVVSAEPQQELPVWSN